MEKIIEKISNYHLFNYLFPGALFMIATLGILGKPVNNTNLISNCIICYFIGLVISRISSLLMEKLLLFIFKIQKVDYSCYILASKQDSKIELLTQDCNMYRSLLTLCLLEIIVCIYSFLVKTITMNLFIIYILMLIILIVLFSFSYRKQMNYIMSRIKCNLNKK